MLRNIFCAVLLCSVPTAVLAAGAEDVATSTSIDAGFVQLMGGFGPAGHREGVVDLAKVDSREYLFEDGSRLIVKRTDFEPGKAAVQMLVGRGRVGLPIKLAQSTWALPILVAGGTSAGTLKEIENWLTATGHAAQFDVMPQTFGFAFSGKAQAADVGYQIAAMCGLSRNPGLADPLGDRLKQAATELPTTIEANAGLVFSRAVQRASVGQGPRYSEFPLKSEFSPDPLLDLVQITTREMQGPFDIAVVGDVDPEGVAQIVEKTCAAGRSRAPARLKGVLRAHFQPGANSAEFQKTAVSGTDGYEGIFWEVRKSVRTPANAAALELLGEVLRVRLSMALSSASHRVNPIAGGGSSDDLPFGGYFGVGIEVSDLKGEPVAAKIDQELRAIARDPALYGQVNAVRRAKATDQAAKMKDNKEWARVLALSLTDPAAIDRFAVRQSTIEQVSPADVAAIAKKLVADKRRLLVSVHGSQ